MQLASAGLDSLANLVVDLDVGASESIDRLLGISHHEERSGHGHELGPLFLFVIACGQVEEDLGLDRIRILELID